MATYSFRYIKGQSGPYGFVTADNDEEAGEAIRTFLNKRKGILIRGTIRVTTPQRIMPDPEWAIARAA